ncbi:MAG: hypothetical protein H6711_30680 [Myxococcales bacterium]|nr:hypothetical protein [Myxococcales bacterium]
MSAVSELSHHILTTILDALELHELHGADGGPALLLPLTVPDQPPARLRLWGGQAIGRLVSIEIEAPALALSAHILGAFAAPGSPLPHLFVDLVAARGSQSVAFDLLPRVDLAASVEWMDAVLTPLTAAHQELAEIEGARALPLNHRLRAFLSPWSAALECGEAALAGPLRRVIEAYVDHWLRLVGGALPEAADLEHSPALLGARDHRYRAHLFSADVDPVWRRIAGLVGDAGASQLQAALRGEAISAAAH